MDDRARLPFQQSPSDLGLRVKLELAADPTKCVS
jgi:hypothetical protein